MEKKKLQTRELVSREVPIHPLLLNMKKQYAWIRSCGNNIQRRRSYHKTITVIFSPCLLQVQDNETPHSQDFGQDVHVFCHAKTAACDGFLQCWSRSQPIATLCPLSLFTMKSVTEYWSKVPNTFDAVRCTQRLNRRKSNNGYSISFC